MCRARTGRLTMLIGVPFLIPDPILLLADYARDDIAILDDAAWNVTAHLLSIFLRL